MFNKIEISLLEKYVVWSSADGFVNVETMIENIMKKRHYINGPLTEEIGDLEINLKQELDAEYQRLQEEKLKQEAESAESTNVEELAQTEEKQ